MKGYTLIEMLICITASLLIVGVFAAIYLAAEKNYREQQTLNTMQANAIAAENFLINDLHLAGYTACQSHFLDNNAIANYQSPIAHSDGITIRHAGNVCSNVERMPANSILYVQPAKFKKGDSIIISDCINTEIFVIQYLSLSSDGLLKLTSATPLKNIYSKNTELGRLDVHHYFVENSSLYLQTANHAKEEIVSNIANLKIKYTILKNNIVSEVSANKIKNWQHIVGVSLAFKLLGNNVLPDQWWYSYARLRCALQVKG